MAMRMMVGCSDVLFSDLVLTGISGYDETIYPSDFRYNGHIVDDDMHAIMLAPPAPPVS